MTKKCVVFTYLVIIVTVLTGCHQGESIKVQTEEHGSVVEREESTSSPTSKPLEHPLPDPEYFISPEPEAVDSSLLISRIFMEQNRILIDNLSIIGMCVLEQKEQKIKENTDEKKKAEPKEETVWLDESKVLLANGDTTINFIVEDETLTITKIESKEKKMLTLPKSIDNKKIECIGKRAFEKVKAETVVLPEGIITIEDQAFYGNEALITIALPSTLENIGDRVFGNCPLLKKIQIDPQNKNYCVSNGVLYNQDETKLIQYPAGIIRTSFEIPTKVISIESGAFSFARYLTYVVIPESVQSIGEEAFAGCIDIDLLLPEHLTMVGAYAFADCDEIRRLIIPKSVTNIEEGTFTGCDSLKTVIFKGDMNKLGFSSFANCTLLEEVQFDGGMKIIDDMAFAYCPMLLSIELPEDTKEVGDMVFCECDNLKSIRIPKNIEYLGTDLFKGANKVQITSESDSNGAKYADKYGIPYKEP